MQLGELDVKDLGKVVFVAHRQASRLVIRALGPDGKSWEKTNYGDFVSVMAPGFASLPVGYKGEPGTYAGTSISAAFTANAIATYLSQNPGAASFSSMRLTR